MKRFLMILFLLFPVLLFSEDKNTDVTADMNKLPVQSVHSKYFTVKNLNFNKSISDMQGEAVDVEFQLVNAVDVPQEFYIFVIATYESSYKTTSSFESPSLDDPDEIKLISTYPDDLSNFEYPLKNEKGEIVKDEKGNEKKVYLKYPKNIKSGFDRTTGQPYVLRETLTFRSRHLSKYGKKFYFFNQIEILIFDLNEELVFRQTYSAVPRKR